MAKKVISRATDRGAFMQAKEKGIVSKIARKLGVDKALGKKH